MSVNPVAQSALAYVGLAQEAQRLRQLAAMLDQSQLQSQAPQAPPAAAAPVSGKGQQVDIIV